MTLQDAIRARNETYENRKWFLEDVASDPDGALDQEEMARYINLCVRGPLYHSEPAIEGMLNSIKRTLPPTTLRAEILPSPHGLWCLGLPSPVQTVEGSHKEFIAFAWTSHGVRLSIVNLTRPLWAKGLFPSGVDLWRFGQTPTEAVTEIMEGLARQGHTHSDATSCIIEDNLTFFLTACLFIRQRLFEVRTHRPDRAMRKWAANIDLPESDVRIVQLRQKQYERKDGEPEERDWSCHWLVRGHWRAQYHPSTDTHEPIWILPHLKGDFDKPFKPPTETVFAVTR